MSGYAIVCDARSGHDRGIATLMLVDRKRCKHLWWTSDDPSIAIRYRKRSAAEFAAKRLRFNDARVVPFAEARGAICEQMAELDYHEAMSSAESGWDAHKGYF